MKISRWLNYCSVTMLKQAKPCFLLLTKNLLKVIMNDRLDHHYMHRYIYVYVYLIFCLTAVELLLQHEDLKQRQQQQKPKKDNILDENSRVSVSWKRWLTLIVQSMMCFGESPYHLIIKRNPCRCKIIFSSTTIDDILKNDKKENLFI